MFNLMKGKSEHKGGERVKKFLKSLVIPISFILALAGVFGWSAPTLAATTADITVTATPSYIAITCNQSTYDFGVVTVSNNISTSTGWAGVTNTASVPTNVTVAVTSATWSGGVTWTHSDTDTVGSNTVGMVANAGGTWGTGDVIVKFSSPNNLKAALAANTNFSFGLRLNTPSAFTDGVQKSNTVRLTSTAS